MEKILIETYGCTLNSADSDIMDSILKGRGYEVERGRDKDPSRYDYIIVNTCTVKTPTQQKILQRLRHMKRLNHRLIVTGCMAGANKDIIESTVPNASILHPSNTVRIESAINEIKNGKKALYNTYNRVDKLRYPTIVDSVITRIPISEGCLSNCSFCETKFARGPLNSFSEELILKAIEMNVKKGAKEVELTSQDTGAYGLDRKTNIAELVQKASEIEGEFKIRIGMLNPEHLEKYFDQLLDIFKSEKVYKFLHMPVQSGSNKVLKEMQRNYTVEEYRRYVQELRGRIPEMNIETDVIVGYPTETEEDFKASIDLMEETKPTVTNVSKFGARPHAKASRLRQLEGRIIKERGIEMSRVVRRMQVNEYKKLIGKREKVLATEINEKSVAGRDDYYRNVAILNSNVKLGDVVEVEIFDNSYACLMGRP